MVDIVDRGIFRANSGYWWMNSPVKDGYASSLRTKDKVKAETKYREILARYRRALEGERSRISGRR